MSGPYIAPSVSPLLGGMNALNGGLQRRWTKRVTAKCNSATRILARAGKNYVTAKEAFKRGRIRPVVADGGFAVQNATSQTEKNFIAGTMAPRQ